MGEVRCTDLTHGSYSADSRYDTCTYLGSRVEAGAVEIRMGPDGIVGRIVDGYLSSLVVGEIPRPLELTIEDEVRPLGELVDHLYPRDEMLTKAHALVALAIDEVLPSYGQVFKSQLEIHWEHPAGSIRHAHLDLLLMDGDVIDWKTAKQRLGNRAADLSVQLTEYACAYRSVAGELPRRVILDGLIYANPPSDVKLWRPNAKKPWWDRQVSTRTHEQLEAHLRTIETRDAVRRIQTQTGLHLTQGRSHPWACHDCPAKPTCPAWIGTEFEEGTASDVSQDS